MSIMSFRLFLLSALLATAFAQDTTTRRRRWRGRTRVRPVPGPVTSAAAPPPGGAPVVIVTSVVDTVVTATTAVTVTGGAGAPVPPPPAPSQSSSQAPAPKPVTTTTTMAPPVVPTTTSIPVPTTIISTTRAVPTTPAAPVVPATSSVPASTSTVPVTPISTGSTKKKGLSFNDASLLQSWTGKNVGWTYNWWTDRGTGVPAEMDFYPMIWCPTKLSVSDWTKAANTAISQGSKRLLGFNEPDLSSQCSISYTAAAQGHQQYMNQFKGKALIGSPAVTNGGGDAMGLAYQENFLNACAGNCAIDFLTMHWYGDQAGGVASFQQQVNQTVALAQKFGISEVFVTEFGLNDGTAQQQADFIKTVGDWMDGQSAVGGYAYFMASDGILNQGKAISPVLGNAYAALS